jgi:hypothetical protein
MKVPDYGGQIHHAGPIDHAITTLANRQRGYVRRQQLLALGVTRHEIDYRIKIGRLIPVYAGVYAVGHVPTLPQDRAFGALLACGPKAALSHATAAAAWGVYKRWQAPFHVTAQTVHTRNGIVVHRAALTRRDKTVQLGLPVTSRARTILDIAPRLSDKALTRAVNDLRRPGHLHLADLADVLARFPRSPGARRLLPLVERSAGPTRSEFEDAFFAFCERFGLPEPLLNVRINGHEVDAYFPEHRLIVELDGWDFHSSRQSFIGDRDKDTDMLVVGLETVRITWERLHDAPEREARRLHAILARRRRAA